MICILIIALFISIPNLINDFISIGTESKINLIISVFESLGLIISLIVAITQLTESKDISRATFILELNKAYIENNNYIKIYNCLQDNLDGKCKYKDTKFTYHDGDTVTFTKCEISNYLTFFETLYILESRHVIDFKLLDDLFAYRFFLAVHSDLFLDMKLRLQPFNFVNIFRLEKNWLEFRAKNKLANNSDTDENKEPTIYEINLLENLLKNEDDKEKMYNETKTK